MEVYQKHCDRDELPYRLVMGTVSPSDTDISCRALFGRDASNDGSCFQRWLEK
jgi:hypothetical protein